MTAYMVVNYNKLNEEKLKEYTSQAGPIAFNHGGEVVFGSYEGQSLSGEIGYQGVVVIKFPDETSLDGYYNSAEYQALIPTRKLALDSVFTKYIT